MARNELLSATNRSEGSEFAASAPYSAASSQPGPQLPVAPSTVAGVQPMGSPPQLAVPPEASLRLSCLSILFLLLAGFVCLGLVVADFFNIIILAIIVAAPVGAAYWFWWRKWRQHATFDYLLRMFAAGAVPGVIAALIVELILQVVILLILFAGHMDELEDASKATAQGDDRKAAESVDRLRHSARFVIFLLLMAFVVAATVEETVKLALVRCTPCLRCFCADWSLRSSNPRALLMFIVAAAMGFSTVENMEYTMAGDLVGSASPPLQKLAIALLRVVVSFPIHSICAGFTGVMLLRREFGRGTPSFFLFVLGPAILVHGSFDAVSLVLGVLITDDVTGAVVVGSLSLAILVAAAIWLRRMLKREPWDDYHRQFEERVARGEFMAAGQAPQGQAVPMVQYVYMTPQGTTVAAQPPPQGGFVAAQPPPRGGTVAVPPTAVTATPMATQPQQPAPSSTAGGTSDRGGSGPAQV